MRRQQLEAEVSAILPAEPVRRLPGMAGVYRQKRLALVEGLSHGEHSQEVQKALRALVDRIVITPELKPGKTRATLTVNVEGTVAGILQVAAGTKIAAATGLVGWTTAALQNAEEPPSMLNGLFGKYV